MWLLLSFVALAPLARHSAAPMLPPPTVHQILAAEYARSADDASVAILDAALASGDTLLQRLAVRAFGRLERKEFASHIRPLLSSPSAAVRRETINAFGQMASLPPVDMILSTERDGSVRGTLYETVGRIATADTAVTGQLIAGLTEESPAARVGAARGLESMLRRTARTAKPAASTVLALRRAFGSNPGAEMRQLLLLALTAAGDRDSITVAAALRDSSAQVRRLAIVMSRRWVANDPSPLVRYQTVRLAANCDQAVAALHDVSGHVVLAAIDVMGEKRCAPMVLDSLARSASNWRTQSRAVVALARTDTARARVAVRALASSPVWQARTYAASAAKLLKDSAVLQALAKDAEPNVAIAAMTTTEDALRGLQSPHFGLVLAAATQLRSTSPLHPHLGAIVESLLRLSARNEATTRDPRMALLQRLRDSADAPTAARLQPLLGDADPDVAALAARIITDKTGKEARPVTTRYVPAPFPSASVLNGLRGATAQVRVKGIGVMDIVLLPDDAPVTVATFAALADKGAYNGLTWHRIVPVFVLQGGSPGADEYDGLTSTYMRDEVGLARNARGAFGISTRGRDTGDGQIFINLVDNFRLDHDYSVFAQMVKGHDVMDRVQEGDVIESITIRRRP